MIRMLFAYFALGLLATLPSLSIAITPQAYTDTTALLTPAATPAGGETCTDEKKDGKPTGKCTGTCKPSAEGAERSCIFCGVSYNKCVKYGKGSQIGLGGIEIGGEGDVKCVVEPAIANANCLCSSADNLSKKCKQLPGDPMPTDNSGQGEGKNCYKGKEKFCEVYIKESGFGPLKKKETKCRGDGQYDCSNAPPAPSCKDGDGNDVDLGDWKCPTPTPTNTPKTVVVSTAIVPTPVVERAVTADVEIATPRAF